MSGGRFLGDSDPAIRVFDDLRDPLCGSKTDIERYLAGPHQHPGLTVELGAQAITLETRGLQTLIKYRFIRNQPAVLTATVETTKLRRHRRGYIELDGAKVLDASWEVVSGRLAPKPSLANIDLGLETKLDHDVAAVLAIKQDLAARLSQVV